MIVDYNPSPTGVAFHRDTTSKFKFVKGPVGGGKTSMALLETFFIGLRQKPDNAGMRRTRWIIARRTYSEIKSTVIKTFNQWLGSMARVVYDAPIRAHLNMPLPDGTTLDIEYVFIALDDESALAKLRSMECTGALVSEASEISEQVFEMLGSRINRYPAVNHAMGCEGATWSGIIAESNPPSMRSWIYRMFEVDRPEGVRMFSQPAALLYDADTGAYTPNPQAENIEYIRTGYAYYTDMLVRSRPEFINVYILGQYGATFEGMPVWPRFAAAKHVAKTPLDTHTQGNIIVGMDFGLNVAASFTQMDLMGRVSVLDELVGTDMTLDEFIHSKLAPLIRSKYSGHRVLVVGDPTGGSRSALAQINSFQMLQQAGIAARPAPTNDPDVRNSSVEYFLARDGGFVVDTACVKTIEGMLGGYRYKKRNPSDMDSDYRDRPEKNVHSHICDALAYATVYHQFGERTEKRKARSAGQTNPRKKYLYA